jgi:acylphosphatase
MVRYYLVKGRVQGVGFRWFVHQEAAALGLYGWVRNTEEGHVEAVAAGPEEDLLALRKAIGRGSRGSRVDRVEERTLSEAEREKLGPFKIEGAW